jgi:hypothetical protein
VLATGVVFALTIYRDLLGSNFRCTTRHLFLLISLPLCLITFSTVMPQCLNVWPAYSDSEAVGKLRCRSDDDTKVNVKSVMCEA